MVPVSCNCYCDGDGPLVADTRPSPVSSMPRIPHYVPRVNRPRRDYVAERGRSAPRAARHRGDFAPAPPDSGEPKTPRRGPYFIAFAALVLGLLALADCGWFGYGQVICGGEVITDRRTHSRVLREVTDKHEQELQTIPGVVGAGYGFLRDKNSKKTGDVGIIVFVDPFLPDEEIDPHNEIPSSITGCKVTVERVPLVSTGPSIVEIEPEPESK